MKPIVFDIETRNTFDEVGSRKPENLDISIVGIYSYEDDKYDSFTIEEFPRLWEILQRVDTLIGFNSNHFDIPLLNKYYPGDLAIFNSIDILENIKNSFGRRLKLDWIAEGILGKNKSSDGLQAVRWWKEGDIDSIRKYCLDDVKITKEVYEYIKENKKAKFKDLGTVHEFDVDVSDWFIKEHKDQNALLSF